MPRRPQRLKLAAVAPALLEAYAEEGITLDQLMAFTVNPDHARQDQVWEALQRSYTKQPYEIRRMLTEGAVRASDRRAQYVGLADYEAAGGVIGLVLFAGSGITDNLADKAQAIGVPLFDFRKPKSAAP